MPESSRTRLDAFRRAGNDPRKDLNADPFTIHIKDCHDCDFNAPHTKYSKLSFTERMQALSGAAQGQGEAAAAASFELANGFYNMSYYGNGRDIYDTAQGNFRDSALSVNMDAAEHYYLQVVTLSSDRELKAKAIFMAAKAEQNRYYSTRKRDADPHRHEYFSMLKASYADTRVATGRSSGSADTSGPTWGDKWRACVETVRTRMDFRGLCRHPTFFTKRMFGGLAAYLFERQMLLLVEPTKSGRWNWHGVLVCTDYAHHASIQAEFPALMPHEFSASGCSSIRPTTISNPPWKPWRSMSRATTRASASCPGSKPRSH